LREAGVSIEEIDHIAMNRNPRANFLRKIWFILRRRPDMALIKDRAKNAPTMIAGLMRGRAKKRACDFAWEKTVERTVHELELATNML
jgi:hypothetical protein